MEPFVIGAYDWYHCIHMKRPILTYSTLNALGTTMYVALVASLLFNTSRLFGGTKDTVLIPISMLLLFILSASITSLLVLGRPILWYLDGKKKDAVSLLLATLGFLFLLTLAGFIGLAFLGR